MTNETDKTHIRVLSVLHIVAGLFLFATSLGQFLLAKRVAIMGQLPTFISFLFVLMLLTSLLIFVVGILLYTRRMYWFCFTVAAVECLIMPLGTVLGVLTLVVLMRPSVTDDFVSRNSDPTAGDG
ncbi:hypothetical protein [Crateriforma conspicua]|uniref:Uncharacterized protein n=1 Tax=Crateriforma conspicua TaxID=2527996 RepID=A0A5C5XT85_9PLAN|nr:hypothetical protein [Crateriforma conspicua]QDV61070.1 hypothetical protein Mal65_01930 [Crateriforma conspicua]QDV61096.1 hypothetical protein Mal65_02190 [Crateriforma conspicua]TWT64922.1 hypothetical protein Pan14r_54650 [Crateriforma conspicua]TWU59545.1 hypothetical protein V7x_55910 [Crateriforma conspicua]